MTQKEINICKTIIKLFGKEYQKIVEASILNKQKEKSLRLSGNGTGNRWCNKYFDYISIYANGTYKPYSDNINDTKNKFENDESIKTFIENYNKQEDKKKGKAIIGIKIIRKRDNNDTHPIKNSIRKEITSKPCVVCGSNSDKICDHKNDMYNDPRVLNIKTQTIDDFQSLCNSCNLRKRAARIQEIKEQKLYKFSNIPQFACFGIDFIGNEKKYDETDINNKVGTYWYDPIAFMKHIKTKLSNK